MFERSQNNIKMTAIKGSFINNPNDFNPNDFRPNVISPKDIRSNVISLKDMRPNVMLDLIWHRPKLYIANIRTKLYMANFRPKLNMANFRPKLYMDNIRPNKMLYQNYISPRLDQILRYYSQARALKENTSKPKYC